MKIEQKLRELRGRNEGAFMPHVYFGDPTPEFSIELVKTLVQGGADLLEFGIPFSDPIADGPAFTAACERALSAGTTPRACVSAVERLRSEGLDLPIVVTTYFNIVYSWGIDRFCETLATAGANGLIVPDLPVEEATELLEATETNGLNLILQVAPTTNEHRLEQILRKASGFVYVINVEGVTGARGEIVRSTLELISRVRKRTTLPILAGFGVSAPEHAKALISAGADGVVVGSAITEIYSKNLEDPYRKLPEILEFARSMKAACAQAARECKGI